MQTWSLQNAKNRFSSLVEACLRQGPQIVSKWGKETAVLQGIAEKDGKPMPVMDGLIAATALPHDLTVITRNTKDMEQSCAKLLSPWEHTFFVPRDPLGTSSLYGSGHPLFLLWFRVPVSL